jgi:uncharacterized membrane protein (DUF373 family)
MDPRHGHHDVTTEVLLIANHLYVITVPRPVSSRYNGFDFWENTLDMLITRRGKETVFDTLLTKIQKFTILVIIGMLVIVMLLSTAHLGVLIAEEIWAPPRLLIPVQGLLDIFGYFLLVLIAVELLETLKAYLRKDVIHVRVVLEVALIAIARKVITEEPKAESSLMLFGIAALILALGVAVYIERQTNVQTAGSE